MGRVISWQSSTSTDQLAEFNLDRSSSQISFQSLGSWLDQWLKKCNKNKPFQSRTHSKKFVVHLPPTFAGDSTLLRELRHVSDLAHGSTRISSPSKTSNCGRVAQAPQDFARALCSCMALALTFGRRPAVVMRSRESERVVEEEFTKQDPNEAPFGESSASSFGECVNACPWRP